MADDDDRPGWHGTATRNQLLAERGYPADIVAGSNGQAERQDPPPAARTCAACGTPLSGKQARFCSRTCSVAAARRAPKVPRSAPAPRLGMPALIGQLVAASDRLSGLVDGWEWEVRRVG